MTLIGSEQTTSSLVVMIFSLCQACLLRQSLFSKGLGLIHFPGEIHKGGFMFDGGQDLLKQIRRPEAQAAGIQTGMTAEQRPLLISTPE